MKVYVVCWASGWQDDHCNTQTNSGIYGAYDSLEKAKAGLEEYKEQFVEELKENAIDPDYPYEDVTEALNDMDIQIYGSVEANYFEIDYNFADTRNEMHISIEETEVH
jgi:hypothetical protein